MPTQSEEEKLPQPSYRGTQEGLFSVEKCSTFFATNHSQTEVEYSKLKQSY